MKYLYKYPHRAYPYEDLVRTNRSRSRHEPEYELLDTGVFDDDAYFDVFVEYAKAGPEDGLVAITVCNRGKEAADLTLLPTLWFRNTWSWTHNAQRPHLSKVQGPKGVSAAAARDSKLGAYYLYTDGEVPLLFTENETNASRLFGHSNPTPFVKDGINNYFVHGDTGGVNPSQEGTKVAAHFTLTVPPCGKTVVRLRLTSAAPTKLKTPFGDSFDTAFTARRADADAFYKEITPPHLTAGEKNIFRQALSGMLWSKQYYYFDLQEWLKEHHADPFSRGPTKVRNRDWFHMVNDDVISMPDKWESPWYAAWDLAFHTYVIALADFDFAKGQMILMLDELYLHPNGQIPAYEWNFGDVNPPVHAIATYVIYAVEKAQTGKGDLEFLRHAFDKLLLNFTWWVNRKDRMGKNVFEGGFLAMDNIGVFDRSAPLPTGGFLEQADGTAWMALFSQAMLEISLELAANDTHYENMALKFVEHVLWIGAAIDRVGDNRDEMWDETDGFFYDVLRYSDGAGEKMKVRSMVGLLPVCAVTVLEARIREKFPRLMEKVRARLDRLPELKSVNDLLGRWGVQDRSIVALVDESKLRRILSRVLDENEFLSDYGIRSLSKAHEKHPYSFHVHGEQFKVAYVPGDSDNGLFGGNSNWRGPIWMPVNMLLLRALGQYYLFFGDEFKIECPTGSGKMMNLFEVRNEIAERLTRIFKSDEQGLRPVYGESEKFQTDPHWKDLVLFYEFFNGDTGKGLGASHQTGWTGLVARLMQLFTEDDAENLLREGIRATHKKG